MQEQTARKLVSTFGYILYVFDVARGAKAEVRNSEGVFLTTRFIPHGKIDLKGIQATRDKVATEACKLLLDKLTEVCHNIHTG